jgi:cysteine desulfurase
MRVYFDYNATTPLSDEAADAVARITREIFGNASSVHHFGQQAKAALDEARSALATLVGGDPSEIIFTSGGTEADNLAVKGIFWARRAADPARKRIISSSVEHHAVLDAVHWLETHEGADVTWLPVDELGRVRPESLAAALGDDVALVTTMWANNEIGTIQPIPALAALAAAAGVPMHTDAIQAVGQVPVDFAAAGVSAMAITAHKLGGPVGVGALVLGRDVACTPLLHGGGQERDVRSGTLDAPGIAAFAVAVQASVKGQQEHAAALAALRDELVARVLAVVPDAILNGDPVDRLPSNAHFSFPGCDGDALLLLLDAAGIACSTGSACSAGVAQPSHVLIALGADDARARSTLRFSLGHTSTRADIDALIAALPGAVERARKAYRPVKPR